MDIEQILSKVDHTLLTQSATWDEIRNICDDAIKYKTASVCIPACYVKEAKEYVKTDMTVCTVIGFPNGYSTTKIKIEEAKDAVANGADEIDMVINVGWVKDGYYEKIENEIKEIKKAIGTYILKVIIETCLLTEEEKIKMCECVTAAGADFIKTSTGFAGGGATFEDIRLFKTHVGENVKIKAAGGIQSLADAEKFIELGADRLGTSRIIKLVKEPENDENKEMKQLIEKAFSTLKYSYSPYSGFKVAATLQTDKGKIYTGCNIENAAYSPSNCAERTAFFKAISEGERSFSKICIVNENTDGMHTYCPPCGVCRQVMQEFTDPDKFEVILAKSVEEYRVYTLSELFPAGFGADDL